jgi:hypothetical protein
MVLVHPRLGIIVKSSVSKDPLELNANFLHCRVGEQSVIYWQSSCYHMAMVMKWRSDTTNHFACGDGTRHVTKGSSS